MKNELDKGGGELSLSSQCKGSVGCHQRVLMPACTNTCAHVHTITEEGLMLSVQSLKERTEGENCKRMRGGGLLHDQLFFCLLYLLT